MKDSIKKILYLVIAVLTMFIVSSGFKALGVFFHYFFYITAFVIFPISILIYFYLVYQSIIRQNAFLVIFFSAFLALPYFASYHYLTLFGFNDTLWYNAYGQADDLEPYDSDKVLKYIALHDSLNENSRKQSKLLKQLKRDVKKMGYGYEIANYRENGLTKPWSAGGYEVAVFLMFFVTLLVPLGTYVLAVNEADFETFYEFWTRLKK